MKHALWFEVRATSPHIHLEKFESEKITEKPGADSSLPLDVGAERERATLDLVHTG